MGDAGHEWRKTPTILTQKWSSVAGLWNVGCTFSGRHACGDCRREAPLAKLFPPWMCQDICLPGLLSPSSFSVLFLCMNEKHGQLKNWWTWPCGSPKHPQNINWTQPEHSWIWRVFWGQKENHFLFYPKPEATPEGPRRCLGGWGIGVYWSMWFISPMCVSAWRKPGNFTPFIIQFIHLRLMRLVKFYI